MPVKFGDDDYRRHNNDDYSFTTRSDSSRDYAMRRRWGDYDEEPMSQISSPLRFPKIGQSNRRSYSPYELPEDLAMPRRRQVRSNERFDEDDDVMDDVISSVKPRRNKFNEYLLDSDEEDEIVLPPRPRYRASPSRFYEEEEEEEKVSPRSKPAAKDVEKRRRAQFEKKAKRGYTMPVSIRRPDPAVGEEEEAMKDIASYIAVRSSFPVEEEDDIQEVPHQKYQYRTRGPQQLMTSHYDDALEKSRDRLNRAPMFDMKLRSHVVWEKMYVKFTCTLRGSPAPKIIWYHNMVPIEPLTLAPGTMKISNQYGVHTLEIFQCKLEDSGTYRISAQNYKGEISSYATLVVRRYDGSKSGYYDIKSGYNLKKPSDYPDVEGLDVPEETPEKKQDSIFISCITATEVPEVKCSKVVSFAAPDAEKYESVLEMHIKGESPIEPIKVLRNIQDKQAGEDNNVRKSKPEVSNELGDFLSMEVNQLEPKRESSILGDVIIEDIVPVKSTHNIKDNDFEE